MKTLTDDQARVLEAFLAEHWAAFENHCEQQGEEADEISLALGGEL